MEARKEKVLVQWTELEADCHDLLLVLDPRQAEDGSELPPLRLELTKARKFNREFLAEQFAVDDTHARLCMTGPSSASIAVNTPKPVSAPRLSDAPCSDRTSVRCTVTKNHATRPSQSELNRDAITFY